MTSKRAEHMRWRLEAPYETPLRDGSGMGSPIAMVTIPKATSSKPDHRPQGQARPPRRTLHERSQRPVRQAGAEMRWSPITGPSRRTRRMRQNRGGIARLAPMTLGGVEQWVLVRGRRADAPILIKIHGGPGQAEIPTIDMNARLEEHFLVVEWDQRGAGKSAAAIEPRASMTLDQIVADTIELTERLIDEFGPPESYCSATHGEAWSVCSRPNVDQTSSRRSSVPAKSQRSPTANRSRTTSS